jgi:hypothetical protein
MQGRCLCLEVLVDRYMEFYCMQGRCLGLGQYTEQYIVSQSHQHYSNLTGTAQTISYMPRIIQPNEYQKQNLSLSKNYPQYPKTSGGPVG